MSAIGTILQGVRNSLTSGFPTRHVAAQLRDFSDRSSDELAAGVFTVLADGIQTVNDADFINLMFTGQIKVNEGTATDADIEEAELLLIDDILKLKQAASANLVISRINQSRRLEFPYGWVRVEAQLGPYDLTPDLDEATLDPFELFHADWDIPPFTEDLHDDWSQEDYSGGEPDAQDDVTPEQ